MTRLSEDLERDTPKPDIVDDGRQSSGQWHKDVVSADTSEKSATDNDIIPVVFEATDPRDPINFSRGKKWAITYMAATFTVLVSASATSYTMGVTSMIADLHCTDLQATLGLSTYVLGFGVVPLVTSSFSEEFGRHRLYLCSATGYLLMHLMVALSRNIQTVIVARFLQGAFGSTGATVVAGTITDIWATHERGLPMSLFSVFAFMANGFGAVAGGWIEMNPHLRWRWIQWIHFIIGAVYLVFVPIIMKETRSTILLVRMAAKLRKQTGDPRYRVVAKRPDLRGLVWISVTRPVYLLFTEPIVISFSLWIGFTWGIYFCMIESISGVFKNLHGFNIGEVGTVYITIVIGSVFGFMTNLYQETLFQKYRSKRKVEARLYMACVASVVVPVAMFIYAWCSRSDVHWISLVIAITIFIWATFTMYLAVFTYLADCYGPFASSALAGQSLFRALMATVYPLFTEKMYATLTYKWANTMFACIALVMMPIPYILFFYGPSIRKRSIFSQSSVTS